MRAVVDAIRYIARTDCQWRILPKEFPPYSTVQRYFYRWRNGGLWKSINHALVMFECEHQGRQSSPSAGVIDTVNRWRRPRKVAHVVTRRRRLVEDRFIWRAVWVSRTPRQSVEAGLA
jgi:transposase